MNLLMISRSVYESDVRVRKEAQALASAGYQVTIVCLGESSTPMSGLRVEGVGGITGIRGRLRRSDSLPYRMARWFLLPTHRSRALAQFEKAVLDWVVSLDDVPDVVHAHDYPALRPAVRIANETGARLVYDSHEFWPGTLRPGRPAPFALRVEARHERRLAAKADAVITISPGAAGLLESRTGLSNVRVVHNSFPLRTDLHPPARPIGAVYAGRIGGGRDLETIFAAETWKRGLELHLIGPSDGTVDLPDWVHAHEPDDMEAVDRLLTSVGVALVPLIDGPANHRIALPNKLFQAVSAGVPVVAADLPEIRRIVTQNHLGSLYRPGDIGSLTRAIEVVVGNYGSYVAKVRDAGPSLDWPRDRDTLLDIYDGLPPLKNQ